MSRRSWVLFAVMCVIWGIPYLLIRVAVRDIAPGTLVFLRTAIGGLLLLPFALRRGGGGLASGGGFGEVLRRWRPLVAFTVIEIAIPWLMLSDAETRLSSSLSGLLIAAVPLVGVLVTRVAGDHERVGVLRLTGLLLGVAGVAMLVGFDVGQLHAWPLVQVALVVVGYAIAPVIMARRLGDLPAIPLVCASLLLVAVAYLPYAVLRWPTTASAQVVASVAVLGAVCTAVAFLAFFALIAAIGPARATVFTYVNPAVAVLFGVSVLGERFTIGMAVGFPLILAGSVLAARHERPAAPDAAVALVSVDANEAVHGAERSGHQSAAVPARGQPADLDADERLCG